MIPEIDISYLNAALVLFIDRMVQMNCLTFKKEFSMRGNFCKERLSERNGFCIMKSRKERYLHYGEKKDKRSDPEYKRTFYDNHQP